MKFNHIVFFALSLLCATAQMGVAQRIAPGGMELESRQSLEAEAARAEAQNRTQEAWMLRTRLQRGDFQDGDRIILRLLGSVTLSQDTVVLRAGKMLSLPRMEDLSLEGVLRSELESTISHHLAKFLKDSSVRAVPLLRVAVLGQVRGPGYYYVQADVLLNDVIMRAGGPNPGANLGNLTIRRGGEIIWNPQDTRTALADGLSLDRLHLRAGDEIIIDDDKSTPWRTYLSYIGPIIGLLTLFRRF
jgi:hypothetical protein